MALPLAGDIEAPESKEVSDMGGIEFSLSIEILLMFQLGQRASSGTEC